MQTTDLAVLPVDAVVRARDGRIWQKWGRDTWQPIGRDNPVREHEGVIKHPVTVLHDPDREQYVSVEFSTSNDAFANEDGGLERTAVEKVLRMAADSILAGENESVLRDPNGNIIGTCRVVDVTE